MIVRTKRKSNFTVIPNEILDDQSLAWRDIGLLCYLLSKPDNWRISIPHLVKQHGAGERALRAALLNLRVSGYVEMQRKVNGRTEWLVFDEPQKEAQKTNSATINQPQKVIALDIPPHGRNAHGGNAHGRKSNTLIKTDSLTKTELIIKTDAQTQKSTFDAFYKLYPRKRDRLRAEKAFKKLKPAEQELAVNSVAGFIRGKEVEYLPYPATYLNGKRWQDEPDAPTAAQTPGSFLDAGGVVVDAEFEELRS